MSFAHSQDKRLTVLVAFMATCTLKWTFGKTKKKCVCYSRWGHWFNGRLMERVSSARRLISLKMPVREGAMFEGSLATI